MSVFYENNKSDRSAGVKGLLRLRCPACGSAFVKFSHEKITEYPCRCGHVIQLTGLARMKYTCPCCESVRSGWTDTSEDSFEHICHCGNSNILHRVPGKRNLYSL